MKRVRRRGHRWHRFEVVFAAAMTMSNLEAAAVDVTTLGVIPNDGINDSPAITAALAGNSELYFPPGEYRLNSTVFIPSNRSMTGAGQDNTRFVLGNSTVAFRVDGKSNVYLADFEIDRPFNNSVDEMIFVYNGSSHVRLDGIKTTNHRSRAPALSFHSSSNCSVRNCTTLDNMRQIFEDGQNQVYGSGITFHSCTNVVAEYNNVSETRDLTMPSNPYFNYHQAGSIQVSGCVNARIEYNTVIIAGQGIDAGGTTVSTIRGNYLDNCHSIGIKLVNGSNAQRVVSNYVSRCGLIGISLGPGNTDRAIVNCLVADNTVVGVGKGYGQDWWDGYFTGSTPAGIHIDAANTPAGRCHDDTIINNSFYDNSQLVHGFINRPSSFNGYNITAMNNVIRGGAAPLPPAMPAPRPVGVPLSSAGALENAAEPVWNVGDQLALSRLVMLQGNAEETDRWSFIVDLSSPSLVTSLALYGDATYRSDEAGPGGLVQIEAATNRYGPYNLIGSRNFSNDLTTNPFSGGKGKRILVTPTAARYLRISGGPWSNSFSDSVVISEVIVNPRVVLDDYSPVHNPNVTLPNPANVPQQSTFDVGAGFENERVALSLVDGKKNAGVNPLRRLTVTLDLAMHLESAPLLEAIVLHPFDSDVQNLPRTGIIKASSTEDPGNMDVAVTSFNVAATDGVVRIPLPEPRQGRYFQVQFLTNQNGSTAEDQQRIGEIDVEATYPGSPASITEWSLY